MIKRFRQFGRAEHVCDALDVVCHRREEIFVPAVFAERVSDLATIDNAAGGNGVVANFFVLIHPRARNFR